MKTRASSVLEISFGLSEASFVCQTQKSGAHDASLFVEAAGRGKSEVFVSLYREVPTTGGLLDAFRLLVLG